MLFDSIEIFLLYKLIIKEENAVLGSAEGTLIDANTPASLINDPINSNLRCHLLFWFKALVKNKNS